ncbi:hypothetical protein E2493_18285, partial [Sphingomonas parva]
MTKRRRSPRAIAFAILLAGSTGSALLAQQTETLGPPALRDFELKGERTTPPAQPVPAEPTRPATEPATAGQPKAAPETAPSARTRAPASTRRAER